MAPQPDVEPVLAQLFDRGVADPGDGGQIVDAERMFSTLNARSARRSSTHPVKNP